MNIQFIKYFVVLAETQSFTKSAEKMHVVQSTLSAGIKKLEEQLDCQLFFRDKRTVRVSNEGMILLPKAKQILTLWSSIESEFLHNEAKVLRIGVLTSLLADAYVPLLKSFQDLYGQFKVHITEDLRNNLFNQLEQGELDGIFIESEMINKSAYNSRMVYEEKLDIAVPVNHHLAGKEKLELSALHEMPFIERCNCPLFEDVHEAFSKRSIQTSSVFTAHSNDTVTALINSGIGVSLLSKPVQLVDGIKFIPIADAEFIRKISLVWRKDNDSKALANFLSV
jgi:DNA-binding transcriptional LysR family regulator